METLGRGNWKILLVLSLLEITRERQWHDGVACRSTRKVSRMTTVFPMDQSVSSAQSYTTSKTRELRYVVLFS